MLFDHLISGVCVNTSQIYKATKPDTTINQASGKYSQVISLPSVGHVNMISHRLPSKPKMGSFPSSKVSSAQVILHGLICEGNHL